MANIVAPTVASSHHTPASAPSVNQSLASVCRQIDTANTNHTLTRAQLLAFFQAFQTALPTIQLSLNPLNGSTAALNTATDTLVAALT